MPLEPFLRYLQDDGLYLPVIKEHSLEKIRRHNYYAQVFASSMKAKWPQRAYVGLYSGAGRARLKSTREIVETTAMSVLRLPDPFTHYIFVDSDPDCASALRTRSGQVDVNADVKVLEGDVARVAPTVRQALPVYGPGNGLLSFCFVDPFAADVRFDVFRDLSTLRMDFLVLLMLGFDARVNFRQYYEDKNSSRIGDLVDCLNWRERYDQTSDRNVIRFLLQLFDEAMVRLGYLSAPANSYHQVTASGTSVLQYVLAFYSKHPLGQKFWQDALTGSTQQTSLEL
jgi:three-Cys-motif partner protein